MPYLYDDEDNAPMEDFTMDAIPFYFPEEPPEGEETDELDT